MYIPSFPTYLFPTYHTMYGPAVGSNIVQITRATFFVNVFFFKWPPAVILDVQKSLLIAFLTISDRYHNFYFVNFLDIRKSLPIAFLAIWDRYGTFFFIFDKMAAAGAHFGCPKIIFDRISRPFQIDTQFLFLWICLTKWHFFLNFW